MLVVLAAVLNGFFSLDAMANGSGHGTAYVAGTLVLGVVSCAVLPLRRRWPVALAVVLIPSVVLSAATMGATAVALLSVAMYRPRRITAAVAALHAVTVITLFGLAAPAKEFWQGAIVVLALDAALISSGLLARSQRLLVRSLRERAAEAEEGNRLRLEEARHNERERIAREMHDVLAHRISLLAVHAGALEVRRSAPEEERRAAGVVRQCAYEALEDLREVIGMLRDVPDGASDGPQPTPQMAGTLRDVPDRAADRPQPTLTDLTALIEESRLAGAHVSLDDRIADPSAAPDGIGRHAYRVVQEGLTNARKHAPGAHVRVRLAGADGGLAVEITNAFSETPVRIPGAGSGLIGLRERMNLVGGRLEHGRTPSGDFRLRAWLPWRP